ncbi:MAG: DNA internalization-related competence protein ComEC/Rec2, partial [Lautropia sp.]|nr:DNA internalization-related competence protein ComEC/Rec2 [Lautropia sp.]
MPGSALKSLPSARLLAVMLLAVASALHFNGRLPGREWLVPMLAALPLLLVAGAWAGRRDMPRSLLVVRVGLALLVVCAMLHWRVHDALASRLPPALEGRELELVGVVDAMPQRFDFGDRVRFSLSSCRIADHAKDGERGRAPEADACGRLTRVQLDWGPLREKDRVRRTFANDEGGHAAADGAGDSAGSAAQGDEDDDAGAEAAGEAIWPQPGQYWRLTVRLKRPVAPANPGGFDLELRYLQQRVGALGRVYARQLLRTPPTVWARLNGSPVLIGFESLRNRLRDRLEAVYADRVDPPRAGRAARWAQLGVVAGLALGDQAAISGSLWGLFSRTGVSHLMAISGMHVTMLALAAAWVVSWILKAIMQSRIPVLSRLPGRQPRQRLVLLVAVLAAFGYALLSGWGIPSQRTCWMLTAAALMSLSGRGRGVLDITLLSAAVIILMDPWAVSTAGFWLSFGAVAAILWCAHGQDTQRPIRLSLIGVCSSRVPTAVREGVTSQWSATIGLAPLVIALFSTLSLIGPVANAVAIPWVSFVITPIAVAAALLAPLSEPLATVLLQINLWMIEHLIAMLSLLDRLPAASVAIPRPGRWTLVAACVGAAMMIAPSGVPMRPAGTLCLLPMLFAPPQLPADDELWITVLDIGQGSSVLVEAGRERLLFDAGSGSGPDRSAVSRFLLPYLRSRGIETIDTLVVSHLDVEHAGGAAAVLQALRPARLVTSFD